MSLFEAENNEDVSEDIKKIMQMSGINQRVIQGKTYELEALKTTPATKLWERVMVVLAPVTGVGVDKYRAGEFDVPMDNDAFRSLAVALVNGLGAVQFPSTCRDMLHGLKCDGKDVDYEEHFKGKLGLLFEVLAFSFEVNFKDFFTSSLRMLGVSEIPTLKDILKPEKAKVES